MISTMARAFLDVADVVIIAFASNRECYGYPGQLGNYLQSDNLFIHSFIIIAVVA